MLEGLDKDICADEGANDTCEPDGFVTCEVVCKAFHVCCFNGQIQLDSHHAAELSKASVNKHQYSLGATRRRDAGGYDDNPLPGIETQKAKLREIVQNSYKEREYSKIVLNHLLHATNQKR